MRRTAHWGVPAALAAAAAVAGVGGDAARMLARFDRHAIADGEWWRLATGHLVHLGTSHTLLNVAALLLVWSLVGSGLSIGRWLLAIVASAAAVDIGLWFLDPQLTWYVGLSGVLHGLFVAGLIGRLPAAPVESAILGGLVAAKIVFEQLVGPLPGSEQSTGGAVVVNAHLYGAIGGLLAASLSRRN